MNRLDEHPISCPYCGEFITLLVDCSEPEQSYTEDCQVCCQPMVIYVAIEDGGNIHLSAQREDE